MDAQRRGVRRRRDPYDDPNGDLGYGARATAIDDQVKPDMSSSSSSSSYDTSSSSSDIDGGRIPGVSWLRPVSKPFPSTNSVYTRVDASGPPSGPAPNWGRNALGMANIGYGTAGLNTGSSGDYMNDFFRGITTFLGQPTLDVQSNPYLNYSQELKDLPDGFAGPNAMMTQIIIEKIREADLWPIRRLLQYEPLTNPHGGTISTLTFDSAMMARTAYEVTGRTVTSRESVKSWKTDLYIIGQTIERGFWKTAKGQLHWAMGLLQIARAALELLCFLAMSKVMTEIPATTTPEEEFGNEFTWANFDKWVNKTVDQWACIQRLRNGVDLMAMDALDIFRQRQVAVSDTTLVLPDGAARYINQTDERTRFLETGIPRSDGDPFNDDSVLKVKGMSNVRVSRMFKLDMKTPPIDEMYRNVSIGGSAYVPWDIPTAHVFEEVGTGSEHRMQCKYKTGDAGFERYFDTSRNVEYTPAEKWFEAGILYRPAHGPGENKLTNAGALFFHGLWSKVSLSQYQHEQKTHAAVNAAATEAVSTAGGIPLSWGNKWETRYKEWQALNTKVSHGNSKSMIEHWSPTSTLLPSVHLHTVGTFYACNSPTAVNGGLLNTLAEIIASHGWQAVDRLYGQYKTEAATGGFGAPVAAHYATLQYISGSKKSAPAAPAKDVKYVPASDYTAPQMQEFLRKAVQELLVQIPITDDRYWKYALQNNIPLFIGTRIAVPDMTWETGSALVVLPGLGKVMAGFSDYVLGARLTRIYDGSFRMLATTVITNPERAVLMPNVFVREYVRGNANEFYGIEHVADYRRGMRGPSMFSFLIPPGFDISSFPHGSHYFDLSGRFPVSLVAEPNGQTPPTQFHYPTAPLYSAVWGFAPQDRSHERKISNFRQWRNTLCFQEMQLLCNVRGFYEDVVPGHGHWGRDAETGDHRMRTGRAGQPRQSSIYFGNSRYQLVTRNRV